MIDIADHPAPAHDPALVAIVLVEDDDPDDFDIAIVEDDADDEAVAARTEFSWTVVHGYETFCHIMRIVDRIFALIQKVKDGGADIGMFRRNDGANPFFSQTSSGLMLEFYYGAPSAILTPWGKFQFSGGSHHCGRGFDDVADLIRTELAAEVFMPLRSSSMGEHGPIWSIGKIDEVKLPAAALQRLEMSSARWTEWAAKILAAYPWVDEFKPEDSDEKYRDGVRYVLLSLECNGNGGIAYATEMQEIKAKWGFS